jgi:type II secretory pathway pseudopilin PulG
VREESGFGLLELLIAMVVLNIGLFALIGAFNAGTVAVSRARYISSATVVADKQMETYRSLQNCAIWLDEWLVPASNSAYAADAYDYNGTSAFAPNQISYWNAGGSADTQYWVTDGTDGQPAQFGPQDNLASCAYISQSTKQTVPLTSSQGSSANIDGLGMVTPPSSAVKPVQTIAGPDGTSYTVDTYIVLVQPCTPTPPTGQSCPDADKGEWAKQVTVVVYDPHNSTRVLAREVSTFDPTVATGNSPG